MTVSIIDHDRENAKSFENRSEAEDKKADLEGLADDPSQIELVSGEINQYSEYQHAEKADGGTEVVEAKTVDSAQDTGSLTDVEQFQQDPISYLKSINTEFVNRIKGTPSISKRGFRFMQAELGISTSSELVATFDDPMGVVIHARAEMPDGRFAEAHGEGYLTESDVSDNEFVRYADSRAKSRAISDLTAAGALAESELS